MIKKKIGIYSLLVCVSAAFLFAFSTSTNPFLINYGCDSAIFRYMGKMITMGKLPYVDAFDHKGPVIFFINAIPQFFTDSVWGIFILQTIFMTASLALLISMAKKAGVGKLSPLFVITVLGVMAFTFEGGNLTEEYSNLFCTVVLWCFADFCFGQRDQVSLRFSAVSGAMFSLIIFMRMNNAAMICAAAAALAVFYLLKKDYSGLLKTTGAFLAGALAVAVPINAYFALKGAWFEFIRGTFLFNLNVSANHSQSKLSLLASRFGVLDVLALTLIFSFGAFMLFRKTKIKADLKEKLPFLFLCLCAPALLVGTLCVNRTAMHYLMLLALPLTFLLVLLLREWRGIFSFKTESGTKRLKAGFIAAAALVCSLFMLLGFCMNNSYSFMYVWNRQDEFKKFRADNMAIAQRIPGDEKNSVLVYENSPLWYLDTGTTSSERYFSLQGVWIGYDESVGEELVRALESENRPKWIVLRPEANPEKNFYRALLEIYMIADQNDNNILYMKN